MQILRRGVLIKVPPLRGYVSFDDFFYKGLTATRLEKGGYLIAINMSPLRGLRRVYLSSTKVTPLHGWSGEDI